MSLLGALNIGSSALAAQQAAVQVTGNNIANAGNANYTAETTDVTENPDEQLSPGVYVGTGVDVSGVSQEIDQALNARLRASDSDTAATSTSSQWLQQIQTALGALSGNDLSTQFSSFFSAWSDLANDPQDQGQRQVVIQDGQSLAQYFNQLDSQFQQLQSTANQQLQTFAGNANSLASQIASLNVQIGNSQSAAGADNSLLDQRNADLTQLSQLMNITTVQQSNGAMNVYVGSTALVLDGQSQGVQAEQQSSNGQITTTITTGANDQTLDVTSGQMGALMAVQGQVQSVDGQVNSLASGLIQDMNSVYSSGQGTQGFSSVTATNAAADPTLALNDPATGLQFTPTNGSFVLHVTNTTTGLSTSTLVPVNLGGTGTPTSLDSLAASLNAISGVSATIQNGQLQISSTNSQSQISFSQDSSGVLSSLGINTFFTGNDATNIGVNQAVVDDPTLLAASANGEPGDNTTALAIASLASTPSASFNGSTLDDSYQSIVNGVATATSTANNNAEAAQSVNEALTSQQQSVSGVSIDEQTVNLIQQQTAYQAAARLVSTVDEMLQSLFDIL